MNVVIVSYGVGNTSSVRFALSRLGVEAAVTSDPESIARADRVILPGVGAAGAAMSSLRTTGLGEVICSLNQPVLGICLGMQLLCRYSEEDDTECLGVIDTDVTRFRGPGKVPHVGWNRIDGLDSKLFRKVGSGSFVYFVHSYKVAECMQSNSVTDYLQTFSAGIQQNNFYGLQFHPEKSGAVGETILKNFIEL